MLDILLEPGEDLAEDGDSNPTWEELKKFNSKK